MLGRNVLILHTGALGDFVLAWPLILALGRIHPQSRIIVVTHASKGALAEAALHVESADIERGWHALFAENAEPAESVVKLLAGAHSIYSFISSEGDGATANLRRFSPDEAKVIALSPRPEDGYAKHASEFLIEQLATQPMVQSAVQQMTRSIATRGISAGRSASGDVLVHPGSGSPTKCWPLERFVKLIQKLRRKKVAVRVLLGEVEMERISGEQIAELEALAEVRRCASYIQLFNELRTASLFIGNDSGPGHLAGVMGIPTLSLLGPTDPIVWKPLGPRVKTLRGDPFEKLGVDDVTAMVMEMLPSK